MELVEVIRAQQEAFDRGRRRRVLDNQRRLQAMIQFRKVRTAGEVYALGAPA